MANALHQLASSDANNASIFQYLVDKGLSWDSEDNNGNGLFNYAARGSNMDMLKLCVSKGLNHSTLNTIGENSLFYASYAPKRGAVKLQVFHYMESLGLEVDLVNWEGKTPLHNAIRYADVELIDYFLQRGVNINQIDENGNTTLLNSIGGPIANVKKVLPLVANTNHKNKKGYTPLTLAVQRGSKEVYDFLVKNELDVNIKDTEGNNLIYHAFESYRDSNEESFDYLITSLSNQLGINNDKVFFGGNTLAHIAVKKNSPYLLSRAISLGTDLNHKNEDGVTPLHMAAMSTNDDSLILALLNSGADKSILTAFKESAYDLATQNELLTKNRIAVDILKTQ